MSNIELIQSKVPRFYKKYEYKSDNEKSIMHAVLDAIADRLDENSSILDRVNACIGINTTSDEDLQYRWGDLLGIYKKDNKSYDLYRDELKLAIPSLIGGTKSAIIYAIATVIGIEDNSSLQDNYITVVDGWEYDGDIEISDEYKEYGHFVCTIDMNVGDGAINADEEIIDAINRVKASGTAFCVLYKGFNIYMYYNLDAFSYDTLSSLTYDSLGQ